MTVDFTMGSDDYRFSSTAGIIAYVFGVFYLNIIVLNLVIALVGHVYSSVMDVRKETELKLIAEMLKELYDFKTFFSCVFKRYYDIGNIYILR